MIILFHSAMNEPRTEETIKVSFYFLMIMPDALVKQTIFYYLTIFIKIIFDSKIKRVFFFTPPQKKNSFFFL